MVCTGRVLLVIFKPSVKYLHLIISLKLGVISVLIYLEHHIPRLGLSAVNSLGITVVQVVRCLFLNMVLIRATDEKLFRIFACSIDVIHVWFYLT